MEASNGDEEISKMLSFVPEIKDLFSVKEKVGEGTFSKVFRAEVKGETTGLPKDYALKYLVPTSRPSRIASELQCLKEVGGTSNIVGVELCVMHKGHIVIVMPYFPHQRFVEYVKLFTADEIRDYMKNLFIALEKVHAYGIIHRDVKPNNFLYDRYAKRYALVDFGLAQRLQTDQRSYAMGTYAKPFKDHNALLMHERLNKSEPALANINELQDKTSKLMKQPSQSTPILSARKRLQASDQENGNPSKKIMLSRYRNEIQSSSSKASILPTPPHTPNRRVLNHTKIERSSTQSIAKRPQNDLNKQKSCNCYGKDIVCKICISRDVEEAPRGGTPGFRAPEVLLKHRQQSTAIDMWSAGVILLSILSRKYPFFRAEDDLTALAEIVFIVGMKEMKDAALKLGKSVVLNLPKFSEEVTEIRKHMGPARYLQALCAMFSHEESEFSERTASNSSSSDVNTIVTVPNSAYDLLNRLLDPNPFTRITASEALSHPFIIGC